MRSSVDFARLDKMNDCFDIDFRDFELPQPKLLRGFSADLDHCFGSILGDGLSGFDGVGDEVVFSPESDSLFGSMVVGSEESAYTNPIRYGDPKMTVEFDQEKEKFVFLPKAQKATQPTDSFTMFGGEASNTPISDNAGLVTESQVPKLISEQYGSMLSPELDAEEGGNSEMKHLFDSPKLTFDITGTEPAPFKLPTPKSLPTVETKRPSRKRRQECLEQIEPSNDGEGELRVYRACTNCRVSKTKCDKRRPCRRCIKEGRPHLCTSSVKRVKRAVNTSKSLTHAFAHQLVYGGFEKFEKLQEEDFLAILSAEEAPNKSVDEDGNPVRALKDKHSKYQGVPCYRNSWCVRQFKHCGHCKRA